MSLTPNEPSPPADDQIADRHLRTLEATREYIAQNDTDAPPAALQKLGEFTLLRELGRGGMGVVYDAQDSLLGRRVALKVLRFSALGDSPAVERFRREAATAAKLHHTNIVPVFSVGSHEGTHYYAMQLVEGRNLAEVLRQGPIDCRRAGRWALEAAEALAHAHRHGVIHRDLKPSNLIVDADDHIWLTDFGLARSLDDPALTASHVMLGTPRYMSPEQASLKREEIDARTDIYSLGATLYELIAGRPPFDGETPHQAMHAILTSQADPLWRQCAEVPCDLDNIVMKCLAKDRADRYAAAGDLADDLRAFLDGRALRACRLSLAKQLARRAMQFSSTTVLAYGTLAVDAYLALASIAATMGQNRLPPFGIIGVSQGSRLLVLLLATVTAALAVSRLTADRSQASRPYTAGAVWFVLLLATIWSVYLPSFVSLVAGFLWDLFVRGP